MNNMIYGCCRGANCTPCGINSANIFNRNGVMQKDTIAASEVSNKVSPRNWVINCFLELPIVLRMPISFARCAAFAVVRLMKLIQPNINKKAAMTSKLYKVDLLANRSPKPAYKLLKCTSLKGCK